MDSVCLLLALIARKDLSVEAGDSAALNRSAPCLPLTVRLHTIPSDCKQYLQLTKSRVTAVGWVQYSNQSRQTGDEDVPRLEKADAQAKLLTFLRTFQTEAEGQQSGEVYKYR